MDESVRNMYAYVSFVDDVTYRNLLKEYGLSEQEYMSAEAPLAIAVDRNTSFNLYTQRYETVDFLKGDGSEIISQRPKSIDGYWLYGDVEDEDGNIVIRYAKDGEQSSEEREYMDLTPEEAYDTSTLKIGKVIYERPYFVRGDHGLWLLYPISTAEAVFDDFNAEDNTYYFMAASSNHTESYTAIGKILNDSGFNAKNLQDIAELEESNRNIVTIIRVFSYGFIVLISLIAAANVFNTISTNISLRRREFAMLKSVGMTAKGFNKMMNYECLLYGSKALLLGLPVSCGFTYLIYLAIMEGYETTFHLPWTAICIAVLSVFLVVFATMMYSMSKVRKDNPIDALKNENL